MDSYPIPAREGRCEIVIQRSRFIASAAPAFSVEAAREYIARVKSEFSDASHNVPAFLIGYGASVTAHCSDDGEPSGTAGKPALTVLKGSGLGDVVVVVTRYFGGIKLGTGGLVKAYSESVAEVLQSLPRAQKLLTHMVMMALPYTYFERVRTMIGDHNGIILDEDFAADVTISARFPIIDFDGFQGSLSELTKGAVQAEIIEANQETIMPMG